ncbi:phospho-N-acetylmuramoyl-pentapeptide-transferase homolog isoform X2 [Argentina anserina]|uniref:phospho-N-acetylmuramoyl-pentapeptide- transferase homolog isoform X2 n=1 Tax=Argentina anserina TaxID=57926 RepID=UPI0021762C72|nr:phospho-N-acetylmuramoyl-pentapeptide-transferase homolog isoform X2 [Potentilla anserina]
MASYSLHLRRLYPLHLPRPHRRSSSGFSPILSPITHDPKLIGLQRGGCGFGHGRVYSGDFDVDLGDTSPVEDWGHNQEGAAEHMSFSSDGDGSDAEYVVSPQSYVDLPAITKPTDDAITFSAYRLAVLGHQRKKHRIRQGVLLNTGLIMFLVVVLLYVDWCAWRIVRLPLAPFHLTCPFIISAALASCAGYVCVPLLYSLKIHQIIRNEGSIRHSLKKRTPTMGGLFFIPVGVTVARFTAGFSSVEVAGATTATLAFAAIGLLDDIICLIKNHGRGLSAWIKIVLEVAVATWFSYWLHTTNISSPYGMKMLVPLPAPLGIVWLGKLYLLLASFCFVSMGNGVNLTDGLDGLAGGSAALAFTGMSIAVLPICSDLAIFGASMAGACVGFLLHNRYKASVFMGDTGSLALGGGLAAMACCTGMFFPLFISSGIFIWEASSIILQVMYFKTTKQLQGAGRRLFRMAPFHHHLELSGLREPVIVGGAYIISSTLSLVAAYIGLISA